MSYSGLVTGCTESRLPFCVTTIFSRPLVDFSVSSETISGKRSTNAMSTMYQTGASFVLAGSKYLWPFFEREGIRIAGASDRRQPGDARRVGVRGIEEHAVALLHVVAHEVARLVVPHALPARAPVALARSSIV